MKVEQWTTKKETLDPKDLGVLEAIDPQLVFLFASAKHLSNPEFILSVQKSFGKATVIGCSTAGEISNSGVSDNSVVITAAHFKKSYFKPASATLAGMEASFQCGKELGSQLNAPDLQAVFVLGQGVNINGTDLVSGLRGVLNEKVVITGGLAGDGGAFKKTFTYLNGKVSDQTVVAVGVYGNDIIFSYGSMGGWKPFGPTRRVTRSSANIMYELDGEPALEVYKKYLGNDAKDLPSSGLRFPFAVLKENEDTSGLIRTILGVDEQKGSLTFAGDIPMGGLVRLMHADNSGLVSGAKSAAENSRVQKAENGLGILVSCVGRKLVMGTDIDEEVEAVQSIFGSKNLVTGFYSYGEICPQQGFSECKLHNQTMTITYLSEKKAA